MIEVNAVLFSVHLELTAAFAILLVFCPLLALSRAGASRRQASALADAFRQAREQRAQQNRKFLTKLGSLEGEALNAEVQALEGSEARFFEHWLTAFVRRDPYVLGSAREALDELLQRYRSQSVKQAPAEALVVEGPTESELALESKLAAKQAAMLKLQMENDKLQRDLEQAKHDIETMMEEYSAMFEGGAQEQERRERKKENAKHRTGELDDSGSEMESDLEPEGAAADDEDLVDAADVDDEFERALREASESRA